MIEWTGEDAESKIQEGEATVLYVQTPMCGTCQLAKRMLTVVEAALGIKVGTVNLNYAPYLAERYEIESVPCLLVFKRGIVTKRMYAFQSVDFIYNELQKLDIFPKK